MVRQPDEDTRGIVDPVSHRAAVDHVRLDPSPKVGRFVAWYWSIEWDLGDQIHSAEVLVHPVVNLTFQPGEARVTGVQRARATRKLTGRGWVLGVMFRPAGFRPLVDRPLTELTDRALPAVDVLGTVADELHRAVVAAATPAERARAVDEGLAPLLPADHEPSEDTTAIVERIAADRRLLRVDQVADAFGTSVRQLQRRFADHVGVSPKWVLQRYRLYDAAEAAAGGGHVDWARLAADLGYSDQAHLVRDFTRAVGTPPEAYARSVGAGSAARRGGHPGLRD
ncbi:MAG TPA: AraC family transcriptional regulator [Acidimicrobiales bacterium]